MLRAVDDNQLRYLISKVFYMYRYAAILEVSYLAVLLPVYFRNHGSYRINCGAR